LDKAMHDARVKVNEHGVEAAAFTVYTLATAALITDKIDFTLDRPFLYVVESDTNVPLFVGAVNEL
ncbi:MAG: serpin family protein, partial [bacterium]